MDDLKKFCEKIRIRRLNADFTTTTCSFCGANFKGYDALQSHIFSDHNIALPPFDDIDEIDNFLREVAELSRTPCGGYRCLHYSHQGTAAENEVYSTLTDLAAYLSSTAVAGANLVDPNTRVGDCRFWTWDTVPALAQYRFFTPDVNDDGADEEEEAVNGTTAGAFIPMGDDEIAAEGTRIVEEGCGSSKIECPYCVGSGDKLQYERYDNDDFAEHLLSAHRIESFTRMLKAFRASDSDRSEGGASAVELHDMIRLINMIREKTDELVTPYSNKKIATNAGETLSDILLAELSSSCGQSTTSPLPTAAQLASVYVVSASEFKKLLDEAPNADFYLLPKRPNDSLITYLLHNDDEDDDVDLAGGDAEAESFPMVPTLREAAAATKKDSSSDDSDSD